MTRLIIPLLASALSLLPLQTPQQPPDPKSPVGHWIADHPTNKQSLVLWWDFHPDGTLTLNAGGIADGHYQLTGNILTLPPSDPGAAPGVFDIHFSDGKLITTSHGDHPTTLEFTRIGPPPSSGETIVGTWRISSVPHSLSSDQEALRAHIMNMVTVYESDGSYHARMPLQTFTGHWDATIQTYKLPQYPALHFERRGPDLLLSIPPDGKDQHLYHPDPAHLP